MHCWPMTLQALLAADHVKVQRALPATSDRPPLVGGVGPKKPWNMARSITTHSHEGLLTAQSQLLLMLLPPADLHVSTQSLEARHPASCPAGQQGRPHLS